ncbi:Vomeronasal type-2 receptor 26 [Fukomys damarensis]|uniref:Vomeronasal type-2 receptor 26 n=1 Tax=Fukomys damarensis TaxID=885580 RepID=A0A091CWL3_FUKDA|nr:Vomeronasal type-2 receptor 26 [Fukomys damarensis]
MDGYHSSQGVSFFPLVEEPRHQHPNPCGLWSVGSELKNYQFALALIFAIEEINSNPHLLPNMSLGFDLHNIYHDITSLKSFLIWLSGLDEKIPNYTCGGDSKSVAVLTGTFPSASVPISTLLELYRFPQVRVLSFGVFDPMLSDDGQFSSLYQMAPKDTSLPLAMVSLLIHFNWNWVGIVTSEDERGVQFLSGLSEEMERNNICVEFVHMIPTDVSVSTNSYHRYNKQIVTSSSNVVIVFGGINTSVSRIFRRWEYFNTRIVWVTTSQWDVAAGERHFLLDPFQGTLIFSHHHGEIPGFKHFMQTVNPSKYPEDISLARLWWMHFNCSVSESTCQSLENCSSYGSLEWLPWHSRDMAMSEGSYNIYNGVHAVARTLHELLLQRVDTQPIKHENGMGFFPWQIPQSVCSSSCGPGFRKSHQEGKPICCFDCIRCPENEISNETNMDQCLRCADHQYPNRQQTLCLPKGVTFVASGDPLGMALTYAAVSFSILTAIILGLFVKHRDTAIVKANNRALSYTLLISLTFCFLCSLLFIGRPNAATCILRQTTFGVVFTVAVSTVLAKTITVVLAFKVTAPGRRMRQWLVSGAPNSIIPICSLIQLTLCGVWMGTNPPFVDTDAHSEHGHIIIVCNKGSLAAFYCVLGYLGSLALLSFTVAFLARNLPDTFNEAKFLTFSMLVFCSVWVTFLPVYHSTKGKVMVAVEVFSILASSAGLLGCIFFPKCYFILLRPEMNCLHQFGNRIHSKNNNSC